MSLTASDEMRREYDISKMEHPGKIEYHPLGQMSIVPTFAQRLKRAGEEGLLIFVKWGLVLVLAFLALNYLTSVNSGAANGTNAVIYLNELQNKGWLPKVVNGQVPQNTTTDKKE